jgi:hypothetical protein
MYTARAIVETIKYLKESAKQTINENQIAFICKYVKGGRVYSLWSKGNYWYELTLSSQDSEGGFKHVAEWHNKSIEEIQALLQQKGFEPK